MIGRCKRKSHAKYVCLRNDLFKLVFGIKMSSSQSFADNLKKEYGTI